MDPQTDNIELQDYGRDHGLHNVPLDQPNPLAIGAEVFRAKESHRRRSWATILTLTALLGVFLITTTVFGVLYGTTQADGLPENLTTTATASTVQKATSVTTAIEVSTQPTTETVTETTVSTETTRRRAKTTTVSVTAFITTTLYVTSARTIRQTASSSIPPSSHNYCVPQGWYGGAELHLLNARAYDVDIEDAIRNATDSRLIDIGQDDPFDVALRSIYQCVSADDVDWIMACKKQYVRDTQGISCAGPSYSTLPVVISVTDIDTTTTWFISTTTESVKFS